MFSPDQVFGALSGLLTTVHSIHLVCYHNPSVQLATVVLAFIAGLLGMWVISNNPYKQQPVPNYYRIVFGELFLLFGAKVVFVGKVQYKL